VPSSEVPTLVLAAGRERSLLRRHPWVFSGAVAQPPRNAAPGQTVRVCNSAGAFLAWAAYAPSSGITARVWSWDEDVRVDAELFAARVDAAVKARASLLPPSALQACRLLHAESDGLPGVIADRFGDTIVLQAMSAGAQCHKLALADALIAATGARTVYERSDGDAATLEGITPCSGLLRGPEPDATLLIDEHGLRVEVDVRAGHKTGFYLDQRDNRALVRRLAAGRDVLDAFCYSGGFALSAALGGARSVQAMDSSEQALALAARNAERNATTGIDWQHADVFAQLRKARDRGLHFDMIVLDPPKLAPTARLAERAARAYKDVNLLAFKLLRPGGLLVTFSCSGGVSPELFQKIVAGAELDARVTARVVQHLHAGPDHPVALAFPEGEYLKGLLCQVAT
jgi:23S rRNA (cytosine1962-C5)-methyltransferase